MQKRVFVFFSIFVSILSFSCSNDYKEITLTEFTEKVLPSEEIQKVVLKNQEELLISTSQKETYKIEPISQYNIEELVSTIQTNNKNVNITYQQETNAFYGLLFWQFINLLVIILFISHIILLCIALRKIIKSAANDLEKILYAIISIFVPFFGPIIYLTTKPKL